MLLEALYPLLAADQGYVVFSCGCYGGQLRPLSQFGQTIVKAGPDKACCLQRLLIVHAAGERGEDMTRTFRLCSHLRRSPVAAQNPL